MGLKKEGTDLANVDVGASRVYVRVVGLERAEGYTRGIGNVRAGVAVFNHSSGSTVLSEETKTEHLDKEPRLELRFGRQVEDLLTSPMNKLEQSELIDGLACASWNLDHAHGERKGARRQSLTLTSTRSPWRRYHRTCPH